MYNEIKQNIINNVLNKRYLYAFGCKKESMIDNIIENNIFASKYDYNNDILTMNLGDNVIIDFKFEWGTTSYSTTNLPQYKITNIR